MNKINQIPLIDLCIWTDKLDEVDPEVISNDIKKYSKTIDQDCPDYGVVSRGFVQFEDLVMPVTPEISKLESTVADRLKFLFGKEYQLNDTWAVDLVKNQSVISHTHHSNLHLDPSEYYSVTYYPQVPEGSAELVFTYNYCGIINGVKSIKPEVGTLVIFNSFIQHMTSRNQSEESRLVVSMNWGPVTPNKSPNADWSVYWDRPIITQEV
jgi:hypothetical protein